MTQKRYRDWRSVVSSKDSMEPNAIVVGIGPQIGFDQVVSVASSEDSIDITLNNSGNNNQRDTSYITDKTNTIIPNSGAVVTPDGILTTFQGDINIPNVNIVGASEFTTGGNTSIEVVLVATHLYVEDSGLILETSIRAIVNRELTSILRAITPSDSYSYKSMSDWYNHPAILGDLDKSSEVIIGLLVIDLTEEAYDMHIPYRYQWPQPKVIPNYMWNSLLNKALTLETQLEDNKKHNVQKGMVQMWDGSLLADIPVGYIFCGKFYIGTGSTDDQIYQHGSIVTSLSALNLILTTRYNNVYGTQFSITKTQVTSNLFKYSIDFTGNVAGVNIPDMTRLFVVNTGTDSTNTYTPGQTGGANSVKLTASESGLPAHTHTVPIERNVAGSALTGVSGDIDHADSMYNLGTSETGGTPAAVAHENRPPFYALAFLKKVI
jgi:hypothetical protein